MQIAANLYQMTKRCSMAPKPRISVSLPEQEYRELTALAERHRISVAWLGRQAVVEFLERYRDGQLQLPFTISSSRPIEP